MKFSDSLKKSRDFQTVYKKGRSYANKCLVLYALPNHSELNRIGISVSKKVGNSVVRHRITRVIRECYRLHEDSVQNGWDLVVIARVAAKEKSYQELEKEVLHVGRLHGLVTVDEEKGER